MDKYYSLALTECQSMQTNSVNTSYVALSFFMRHLVSQCSVQLNPSNTLETDKKQKKGFVAIIKVINLI